MSYFFSKIKFLLLICLSIGSHQLVNAQQNLIPLPTNVDWQQQSLSLKRGIVLEATNPLLKKEYAFAEALIAEWKIPALSTGKTGKTGKTAASAGKATTPTLQLILQGNEQQLAPSANFREDSPEAYELKIDAQGIRISAHSAAGIYYGLQTLKQFEFHKGQLQFCHIKDQPAYRWRAFLLDVGRNYQSMELVKQQVDVMARYKLNVLHFHFTEDLAWRLASKKHPGLTDPAMMTRWKGDFYTEAEFKSLMQYCADRHITLVPEIDMPGHSAAFERYFGVNMQTDSGITFIKELLQEFADTYPGLPYFHIGGDEVKIKNNNFMPEITRFVEHLGYKTIAWDPGSNILPTTIRQLWMGGPKEISPEGELQYIDSKHLYVNHMDPIETVTTLFFRQLGAADKEHQNLLGATLCAWPDRAVVHAEDMFLQNAIYPSLITFGERSWRGGGQKNWVANLPNKEDPAYAAFVAFEQRLLTHQQRYFQGQPFPYVQHSQLTWDLVGPFDNAGDLGRTFPIEKQAFDPAIPAAKQVSGGTVILRHWWSDVVQGALDKPEGNSTWYARSKFWSPKAGTQDFWIGFHNLSRSYESDSPRLNTWDNKQSALWLNGTLVAPPQWKQAGLVGNLEKPLLDEGYSFREPLRLQVKKGWNEVLIKMPAKNFQGDNWQNPMKWMFSFMPLQESK